MTTDITTLYNLFTQSNGVTTDSRAIKEGVIFFALRGERFDGNDFALTALEQGAAYAVIDRAEVLEHNTPLSSRLLLVENTLTALQQLASLHRQRLGIPIFAIAGSNGKTTTKELVKRVLAEKFVLYATHGNLNNHIGVPLTLLSMDSATQFGIVEMGASAQGEIALLCSIAQPNYGILTNIGNAHLEGFGGKEGIRRGKGELYDYLAATGGVAFIPEQDSVLSQMATQRQELKTHYYDRAIGEGYNSHLSGDYNRYNIAAAVAVGMYFDIDPLRIAAAIESYIPDNNRSQEVTTQRGNLIIIDCYNANPSSMEAAITNIASKSASRRLLILGDMLELGEWSLEEHSRILTLATQVANCELLLVGEHFRRAAHAIGLDVTLCTTTQEAISYLSQSQIKDTTILIKGSRGIALERIIPHL